MKTRPQGFTMIELIVVIVILGILAATALPKFIDMNADAKAAALAGVAGAAGSAMAINYSGCAVTQQAPTADKCVKVDNCNAVGSILQGGLPAGYTVASVALTPNGAEADCTVLQTGTSGAAGSATFKGLSAGNSGVSGPPRPELVP